MKDEACWAYSSSGSLSDLNENGLYRRIYLNAWSAVGGTVWERLGGVVLLEAVCTGSGLEVLKSHSIPH